MIEGSMERREFLRRGLIGVSVAGAYPFFLGRTAAALAAGPDSDRVLVVLQLSGGNDGLSTVVPYSDPEYGRARTTIRIGEGSVLKIDDRVGLHPGLDGLKGLFDLGEMAIVQGASYPNPTRSHFEAMDVWHAADRTGARRGTGWLGRALDSTCGNRRNPLTAVHLGEEVPLALTGLTSKPVAFRNPGAFQWRGGKDAGGAFSALNSGEGPMEGPVRPVDFLRKVAADASASSEAVRVAAREYRESAEYPRGNRLAEDLRLVAAMIAGGLPTRVFYVSLGGFDTHANQKNRHDQLMRTLSTAVSAFIADLRARRALDRVLVLAFSEFGRRVAENGSRGTDHGVAAPMFLLGGCVVPGLHGEHPSLTRLTAGDLVMTVDFREVYASVLERWLGAPGEDVLGKGWKPLPVVRRKGERAF
jgi:uncharacterized protein (DUF1501 family)